VRLRRRHNMSTIILSDAPEVQRDGPATGRLRQCRRVSPRPQRDREDTPPFHGSFSFPRSASERPCRNLLGGSWNGQLTRTRPTGAEIARQARGRFPRRCVIPACGCIKRRKRDSRRRIHSMGIHLTAKQLAEAGAAGAGGDCWSSGFSRPSVSRLRRRPEPASRQKFFSSLPRAHRAQEQESNWRI
jgi:hypothetical protein